MSETDVDNDRGDRVQTAVGYAQRGWALLPIRFRSKEPNVRVLRSVYGTSSWGSLRARPASPPEIREWFRVDRGTNIGVICGAPSGGLVVADCDGPSSFVLPPTPAVATARGRHLYLRADGATPSRKMPWGDLKGEGGYVLLPPSVHPSGATYSWTIPPQDAEPAPLECLLTETSPVTEETTPRSSTSSRGRSTATAGVGSARASDQLPGLDQNLAVWDGFEPFVSAVCTRTGMSMDGKFCCVIHRERNPSAALWRAPSGQYLYMDFHGHGLSTYTLTRAYASWASGSDMTTMTTAGHVTWKLRALVETGFLMPVPVTLPLPVLSPDALRLRESVELLFAVKWTRQAWAGHPQALARRFLVPWSGLSERRAVRAFGELLQRRVVVQAGRDRSCRLYLPGPQ